MTGANPGGGAARFDLGGVSPVELEALRRTVAYHERHWDDESQTLFGVCRDEMRAVLAGWPESLARADPVAALAVNNALNHSVNGAPPPGPDGVLGMAGLAWDELRDLFERLRPRLHAIIDRA